MTVDIYWLALPAAMAVGATWTDYLPLKMGVPLVCAVLLSIAYATAAAAWAWPVVGALVASAAGDWFLSNKEDRPEYFVAGIGFYLCAHLGYLVTAVLNGGVSIAALAVLAAMFVPYHVLGMRPAIRNRTLRRSVLVYLLVSCVTLAAAMALEWEAPGKTFYIAGVALIVLSDLAISLKEFLGVPRVGWIILPTYYLAHLAITAGMLGMAGA